MSGANEKARFWRALLVQCTPSHAYWVKIQVTACPLYGGIRLPLAIGAVVLGVLSARHTPLSGQISPVRALVPIGACFVAVWVIFDILSVRPSTMASQYRIDKSNDLRLSRWSGMVSFAVENGVLRPRGAPF